MSLFPAAVIDLIAKSAYWADRSIRSELVAGQIAGENDYTSNFTAEFRRQINAKAYPGLVAISFVPPSTYERKVGVDACIVLSNNTEAKICLFEGKWPTAAPNKNSNVS